MEPRLDHIDTCDELRASCELVVARLVVLFTVVDVAADVAILDGDVVDVVVVVVVVINVVVEVVVVVGPRQCE